MKCHRARGTRRRRDNPELADIGAAIFGRAKALARFRKKHGNKKRGSHPERGLVHKARWMVRRVAWTDYQSYLASEHWKHIRSRAFQFFRGRCCRCRKTHDLQVHHKTYKRLGREKMRDLELLCEDCHSIEHEKDGVLAMDPISKQFRSIFSG